MSVRWGERSDAHHRRTPTSQQDCHGSAFGRFCVSAVSIRKKAMSSLTKAKPEEGSAGGVSAMLSVMTGAEWRMMGFDTAFDPKWTLAK